MLKAVSFCHPVVCCLLSLGEHGLPIPVIYAFVICIYRLNLRELEPLASHMRWFIWLMAAGGTIYVFLYHEK